MTSKDILQSLEALTLEEKPFVMEKFKNLLKSCLVQQFDKGDERPCEEMDFEDFKIYNEGKIYILKIVLEEFIQRDFFNLTVVYFDENEGEGKERASKMEINDEIFTLTLIICGENNDKFKWNTENSVVYCREIEQIVLKINDVKHVSDLLVPGHSNNGLFKNILLNLRPKLLSDTWKCHPSAVVCYSWALQMVAQPHLSPFINDVLPTALILVDDYINENRVIGIVCLNHITENTTITELKLHGHGDVVYKALEPLLHNRDADLVVVLLPCLLKLITKLETNIGERDDETKWSRFDDVLDSVLENMELEHLIALREAYVQHLTSLVKAPGIRIIRWSRRLLRILKEYLEVSGNHSDIKTTIHCLEAMENYLRISKPVVHLYSSAVLFMLFKTLYNVTSMAEDEMRKEAKDRTVRCIRTVMDQLPQSGKEQLKNQLTQKMSKNAQCRQFFNLLNTIL